MAVIKRKNLGEPESEKSRKKLKSTSSTANSPASLLSKEEPSFPRGGASILTPLEQKQIQIQATRDVLFEQRTGKRPVHSGSDDDSETENLSAPPASQPRTSHKLKSKSRSKKDGETLEASSVRVEGLSYKARHLSRLPRMY